MVTQQERIKKIENMTFKDAEKMIYMWVKQGQINLKQFRELNNANRFSSVCE